MPDPQDPATFARSKLDWAELVREPHAGLLGWYRALIDLRRRLPALRDGDLSAVRVRCDERRRWLVTERRGVSVAANLGATRARLPMPRPDGGEVLLASEGVVAWDGEGLVLPAESAAVVATGG